MARKKLPPDVLEYFRQEGAKGGAMGGKKYWSSLTQQEASERNKAAAQKIPAAIRLARSQKAAEARKKQAAARKKAAPSGDSDAR